MPIFILTYSEWNSGPLEGGKSNEIFISIVPLDVAYYNNANNICMPKIRSRI